MSKQELLDKWKTWYLTSPDSGRQELEDYDFEAIFVGFCAALGVGLTEATALYYEECRKMRCY